MRARLMICGLALGCAFVLGYRLAALKGAEELQALQLQAAQARAEQGRKDYAKTVAALDALDAARLERERTALDAERVRKRLEARLRAAEAAAAPGADGAHSAGCARLLERSIGLLDRCRGMVVDAAARHDALANAVE